MKIINHKEKLIIADYWKLTIGQIPQDNEYYRISKTLWYQIYKIWKEFAIIKNRIRKAIEILF